tara:strand:- start:1000 stop:1254 length:255 start_codon:yes stop_codon:yes gene_type:complete
MKYDDIELEELTLEPGCAGLVQVLCGLNNNPELLSTTDKFRISCVEALRLGYLLSKYLGVDREEFIEGVHAVIETEDHLVKRYH